MNIPPTELVHAAAIAARAAHAAYTHGAADAFCGGLYYSGPHASDYLRGAKDAELAARGIGPIAALGNMGRG